eukprot:SAG25_NODE_20_length_23237_cov_58.179229_17_plen_77_part_00
MTPGAALPPPCASPGGVASNPSVLGLLVVRAGVTPVVDGSSPPGVGGCATTAGGPALVFWFCNRRLLQPCAKRLSD